MCAHPLNALFSVMAKEKKSFFCVHNFHVNKRGLQILPQGRFESEKEELSRNEGQK